MSSKQSGWEKWLTLFVALLALVLSGIAYWKGEERRKKDVPFEVTAKSYEKYYEMNRIELEKPYLTHLFVTPDRYPEIRKLVETSKGVVAFARRGISVAGLGDVNADGRAESASATDTSSGERSACSGTRGTPDKARRRRVFAVILGGGATPPGTARAGEDRRNVAVILGRALRACGPTRRPCSLSIPRPFPLRCSC